MCAFKDGEVPQPEPSKLTEEQTTEIMRHAQELALSFAQQDGLEVGNTVAYGTIDEVKGGSVDGVAYELLKKKGGRSIIGYADSKGERHRKIVPTVILYDVNLLKILCHLIKAGFVSPKEVSSTELTTEPTAELTMEEIIAGLEEQIRELYIDLTPAYGPQTKHDPALQKQLNSLQAQLEKLKGTNRGESK